MSRNLQKNTDLTDLGSKHRSGTDLRSIWGDPRSIPMCAFRSANYFSHGANVSRHMYRQAYLSPHWGQVSEDNTHE